MHDGHSRSWRLGGNVVHDPVDSFDLEATVSVYVFCDSVQCTCKAVQASTRSQEAPRATYLVCYSGRDLLEDGGWENEPIGSHEVFGRDGPESHDLVVCTGIAGYADGLDGQEGDKGLGNLVIQTCGPDFLNVDIVGVLENLDLVPSDFAEDSDGEAWSWEGMTADEVGRNVEESTQCANLV